MLDDQTRYLVGIMSAECSASMGKRRVSRKGEWGREKAPTVTFGKLGNADRVAFRGIQLHWLFWSKLLPGLVFLYDC